MACPRHACRVLDRHIPSNLGAAALVLLIIACDGSDGSSRDDDGADATPGEEACLSTLASIDGTAPYVYSVDWSPIDDFALAGTREDVRLLSVDTGSPALQVAANLTDRATAGVVRWSADGRFATSAGDELKLLAVQRDPPALVQLAAFSDNQGSIYGLDWSADGAHLITGEHGGAVRVFAVDTEAGTLTQQAIFYGHIGKVQAVSWSPDGRHASSVGDDGSERLLEVNFDADPVTIEELALERENDIVNSVRWAPGGAQLLTGTWAERHVVQIWSVDTEAGTLVLDGEFGDHPSGIDVLQWSRDERRILTAGHDDTVRLSIFEDSALTGMAVLENHDTGVHSASWSPDEDYIIVASSLFDRISLVDMRACPTAGP
jgi:WD40 repeat protein